MTEKILLKIKESGKLQYIGLVDCLFITDDNDVRYEMNGRVFLYKPKDNTEYIFTNKNLHLNGIFKFNRGNWSVIEQL